jgi:hypothetical protein
MSKKQETTYEGKYKKRTQILPNGYDQHWAVL